MNEGFKLKKCQESMLADDVRDAIEYYWDEFKVIL